MFRFIIKSVIMLLSLTSGHSSSIGDRTEYCHDSPVQLCRMICPPVYCLEGECAMRNDNCCSVTCNVSSFESKTRRRIEDGDHSNANQGIHLKNLPPVHKIIRKGCLPGDRNCLRSINGFQVEMEQGRHQMFEFQMLMFFLLVFLLRLRYI